MSQSRLPINNPEVDRQQSLSDYLSKQKNLRTKTKMRNVRLWKRAAIEYQQQALPIDDPANERVEKPDSNKSIDTKEMHRLQQIESEYQEQEKILKLVAKQTQKTDKQNQEHEVKLLQNGRLDLAAIFANNMMGQSQHLSSNQTPSDPQKRTNTSQAEVDEKKKGPISSAWVEQQIRWLNREHAFLSEMS